MTTDIYDAVRDHYRQAAVRDSSCCGGSPAGSACCGSSRASEAFGYSFDELKSIPEGADLSLGCGNPTAIASIAPGETVVDLGSGGGIDCFLAARQTGANGRVIGVDMTPEMISRARRFATEAGYHNVEFRLGEIEHLPIADASVDLIISNCVINLAPDKARVFAEAFRVLQPGGRMMISDIVLTDALPAELRENVALLTGCIAGASLENDYLEMMRAVGFEQVRVAERRAYATPEQLEGIAREAGIDGETVARIVPVVDSVTVQAIKPAG